MTVRRTWEIRIKNGNECIASVTVPEYTCVDVSPVYEGCSEIKLDSKWNGEIAIGKPFYSELVWHKATDTLPIIDGRYLVCTKAAKWPIIAHACTCQSCIIWSRLIRGTHELIETDEVYWWAEIPLPEEES